MNDIRECHSSFYKTSNKTDQDSFILKHLEVSKPKRRSAKRTTENVVIRYFVKVSNSVDFKLQVCAKRFLGILGISRFRVNRIARNYILTGEMPREKRGGPRNLEKHAIKRESVKAFIEKLQCVESHYCRGKSCRQYLPSELNILKLMKMYNNSVENHLKAKRTFFRNIFCQCYNIGFNAPVTDACSRCIELKEKIKTEKVVSEKNKLMVLLRVHKLRSKAFFNKLREEKEDMITLSFDCQKNLVNPKVPDQLAYYSRQIYTYNFTIVKGSSHSEMNKDNVFIYTWMENEFAKGSNEICSAIYRCLMQIDLTPYTRICLCADGCGEQNRNSTMINMLSYFLLSKAPTGVKKIELVFPIPGHSFLPPDRVFGRIEKELRKILTICDPNEYIQVFDNHGTVRKLDVCDVYDWKSAAIEYLKKLGSWHFKFSQTKRFIFSRNKAKTGVLLKGEPNYNSHTKTNNGRSVVKKGLLIAAMDPQVVSQGKAVKMAKVKDVAKLLTKHFGEEWPDRNDLDFFKTVVDQNQLNPLIEEDDDNQDEANDSCGAGETRLDEGLELII